MGVNQSELGFSILELIVCLLIISILSLMALPSYRHVMRRAYYLEVVQAAMPYKLGVSACYQQTNDFSECHGGQFDIPRNAADVSAGVAEVSTDAGVITVVPKERHGLTTDDKYVLTPIAQGATIRWHASGRGVANGYTHGNR